MLDYFGEVNWWVILVCAVISMIVGFIWYGPLFGKPWGNMTGWTKEKVAALPQGNMIRSYVLAFIAAFIIAMILALTLAATSSQGVGEGVLTSVILWIGFTGATIGVNMTFQRRPISLYGIEAGYHLVAMIIYSILLSVF